MYSIISAYQYTPDSSLLPQEAPSRLPEVTGSKPVPYLGVSTPSGEWRCVKYLYHCNML